jgi:hypothetical protein
MSDDEIKVRVTGDSAGVQQGMQQAVGAVRSGVGQMKSTLGELQNVGSVVQGVFVGIAAVLAGGRLFKDSVQETQKLTTESMALGKALGITASEASVLKVALDDVHVSQDTLQTAAARITTTLRTNEAAFGDLGVKARDNNHEFRSTMSIMQDVNKRLLEFKEGTDRNIEGQKIYGRAWAEIAPVLKLTAERMEEAREKAAALGLVVGQENVEATKAYRDAMNEAHDVVLGVEKAIGEALMPVLTDMGKWLASIGPDAVNIMRRSMAGLVAAFYGAKFIIEEVWGFVKAAVQSLVVQFLMLADVANRALHFDFKGAVQAWRNGVQQMADIGAEFLEGTADNWEKTQQRIADAFERSDGKATPTASAQGGGGEASSGGKKTGGDDTRFAEWKGALEKLHAASGEYRKEDLAGELDYWQKKLTLVTGNTEKDKALRLKIEHEIFDVKKQIAQQERELAEEGIAQAQAIGEEELSQKREMLEAARELGQISQVQEINALKELEQQKYAVEEQALEARRKLAEHDVLARKKLDDQLALMHKQQLAALTKSDADAAIARQKQWQATLQPISNAIGQSVQGMIQGTLTMRKAIANLGQSILGEFISLAAQRLTVWVASEAAITETTVAGAAIRTATEQAAAKQGLLATAGAAIKKIAIRAVEVMASVYSAIAGIPYVGPFLAPVMAIAAGATVVGYISRVASARGGYDIPQGVNPMTQLHEKEMVLPQKQADVIRDLAGGRGGGMGRSVTLNLSALDGKSVEKLLRDPRSKLSQVLRDLGGRNFVPVGA